MCVPTEELFGAYSAFFSFFDTKTQTTYQVDAVKTDGVLIAMSLEFGNTLI